MIPKIIKAHSYWTKGINPWSRIPVIGRRVDYIKFIQEYATEADVKQKLYVHITDPLHLRGMRFAMVICVESYDFENYDEVVRFVTHMKEKR